MDLLILYHLLNDLTDEKCELDASLLATDDLARQDDLKQRVHQLVPLLAEIRGEVLARELPGARSTVSAQEFETHVHCVLKAYGALEAMHGAEIRRTA